MPNHSRKNLFNMVIRGDREGQSEIERMLKIDHTHIPISIRNNFNFH